MSGDSSAPARRRDRDPRLPVRAGNLLRVRRLWVAPLLAGSVIVAAITALYIGSVVNPAAHLRGLPVAVVNEDQGGMAGARHLDVGRQVQAGLLASPVVSEKLHLELLSLSQAQAAMDRDGLYATVVIPPGFTGSLLNVAGQHVPSAAARTAPRITLLTNQRAGTEGVSLATGILQPALAVASRQIGQHLTPLVPPSARTGATKVLLTDPVTVTTTQYRPVPQNSALGLSAFYIALLTILSGFIGGVIVNSVVDTTLGYAINELGPRYRQRPPVSIDRWRTLLIKWAIAFPLTGAITGVILLVAAGGLGMNAPYPGLLWVYTWLCALSVAAGLLLPPAPGNSRTAKLARASRPRRRPDGSCSGGAETLNAPLATLGPRLAKPAGPGCQFLVAPPTV